MGHPEETSGFHRHGMGGLGTCWNSANCCELVCTFRRILMATSCPQYTPLYKSPKAPDAILSWNAISDGSNSQSSDVDAAALVAARACAQERVSQCLECPCPCLVLAW